MNLAMNRSQPTFDWCLLDEQNGHDAPVYSHDIYACPAELSDLDSLLNCDISALDSYLHPSPAHTQYVESVSVAPVAIEQTPVHVVEQQTASTSVSDDDVLEEFFPELNPRPRNHSSSTVTSSVRSAPYEVEVSDYRVRRDRNNEASKKSRAKRAEKFQASKSERADLEKRNIELRTTLAALEVQVADYKRMVLMVVGSK